MTTNLSLWQLTAALEQHKQYMANPKGKGWRAIPTLGLAACYRRDARTLMKRVFPRNQLKTPFPGIGKGVGERVETHSYEEGARG